jgi:hypothetical protein
MALSDSVLENKLTALSNLMKTAPMTDENYAKQLAKIITEQIKSAVVNPGITVQVDPVTGIGATTGTGALA